MAIKFLSGKLGGGKGVVLSSEVIIDELKHGTRCIITNFAVEVHPWVRRIKGVLGIRHIPELGLRSYLVSKFGQDFDCAKRIFVINDDEIKDFYLYRVIGGRLVKLDCQRDDKGRVESWDTSKCEDGDGIVYIIDEAWKFFASRDWQKTEKGLSFYAPQQRKLSDDLWICCQSVKQVDVMLVRMAQEFWHVINRGKMRAFMFRQPDIFDVRIYDRPPDQASASPMHTKILTLDKKGLGSTFNTAAGVGLKGGGADIGERKKGLPWWLAPALALVAILGLLKLTDFAGDKLANAFEFGGAGNKVKTATPGKETSEKSKKDHSRDTAKPGSNPDSESSGSVVYCVGYVLLPPKPQVILSNGQIIKGYPFITADSVTINGVLYPFKATPVSKESPPSFTPAEMASAAMIEQPAPNIRYIIRSGSETYYPR